MCELQANCHIGRNTENIFFQYQIPRMDDITAADPALILFFEFCQRSYGIIGTGFDLNGEHLILGFAVVGNDEVDLNVIALLFYVICHYIHHIF